MGPCSACGPAACSGVFVVRRHPAQQQHGTRGARGAVFVIMDSIRPEGMSSSQREDLMDQVKQQIVIANTQELLTKMGEKCFSKCITKPGSSLDSSEQKCLAMCMDRYMDCWNLVSRTYTARLQREKNFQ